MPTPQLPQGFVLDAPAQAASGVPALPPGFIQDKEPETDLKYLPGFVTESLRKMFGGGFLQGGVDLSKLYDKVSPIQATANKLFPQPREAVQKVATAIDVPSVPDEKGNIPLWDSALRGAGRSLTLPLPGAGQAANILAGATSGMGGELGRRGAASIAPNSPGAQKAGEIAGGVLGGLPTAFLLGPRMPVAQQDIKRALGGTSPEQFAQAEQNARDAAAAGARTATGAEMFAPNSPIMALATKVRGGTLDNALRRQTENRPQDLQDLADTFLNRIGPAVDPNQVANQTAGAANSALAATRALPSEAMGNRLRGVQIQPTESEGLRLDLLNQAINEPRAGAAEALREVGGALRHQQTREPLTNLQDLSLAIKGFKNAPRNPNPGQSTGAVIGNEDVANAARLAELGLGDVAPTFRSANNDFRAFMQGPMQQMREGPIGSLADKNPLTAGQTPVARLQGLMSGNSPQTIEGTMRVLGNPAMLQEGAQAANPLEIARALSQQTLRKGSTNPGADVRGLPGSQAEDQLSALLRSGGANPNQVLQPLRVADQLQAFSSPAGVNELPKMGLSNLIRPFRTLDMLMSGRHERSVANEVSNLLANSSPENIRRLQEIAMTDPYVRSLLTARGAFTGEQ